MNNTIRDLLFQAKKNKTTISIFLKGMPTGMAGVVEYIGKDYTHLFNEQTNTSGYVALDSIALITETRTKESDEIVIEVN